MSTQVQTLRVGGKNFVVLERAEYERLRALERSPRAANLPRLPPADRHGNRPALEFVRVSIARDIIKERTALGLTQEQLARMAGIRQETLCRLETGKHSPTVRTVERIDRVLQAELKRTSRRNGSRRSR